MDASMSSRNVTIKVLGIHQSPNSQTANDVTSWKLSNNGYLARCAHCLLSPWTTNSGYTNQTERTLGVALAIARE
jgi:hypothetical protein